MQAVVVASPLSFHPLSCPLLLKTPEVLVFLDNLLQPADSRLVIQFSPELRTGICKEKVEVLQLEIILKQTIRIFASLQYLCEGLQVMAYMLRRHSKAWFMIFHKYMKKSG